MTDRSEISPILSKIREKMAASGYVLFEEYEALLSSFVEGEATRDEFRKLDLKWATRNLRDVERRILKPGTAQSYPKERAPMDHQQGLVSKYIHTNGGYNALVRRNKIMFDAEVKSHLAIMESQSYLAPEAALSLQKQLFREAGYVVRKRQGYSFFEYGKKEDRLYPFTIYFAPFNLKRETSRAGFNLSFKRQDGSSELVRSDNLFPCIFFYQLLHTNWVVESLTNLASLIEDRVRLHIKLLELLMAHFDEMRAS